MKTVSTRISIFSSNTRDGLAFSELINSSWTYIARRNLVQNIREFSCHFKDGHLLDVGSGTKPYELLFNVDHYVGLEIPGGGHDDRAKSADVYYNGKDFPFDFPFKESALDYVILNEVLEHVFEPNKLIGDVYSLLKRNGLLLITVPFVWDEHEKPHDYGRYTFFGLKYLIHMSKAHERF